jgi:hypothetical protein
MRGGCVRKPLTLRGVLIPAHYSPPWLRRRAFSLAEGARFGEEERLVLALGAGQQQVGDIGVLGR